MARQAPERRDPPVEWVRLRYTKLGPARFTSARDVGRLMERALKRAGVAVAYSSGFNPHQRVSYAFPAPTGAASDAEYALVALAEAMDADELASRLNVQMPDGMNVSATATTERHLPPLLEASRWRLTWPAGTTDDALGDVVAQFLAAPAVTVQRRAKSGVAAHDVRGAVVSLDADDGLTMVLRQGEPLIRPTDVLAGLERWLTPSGDDRTRPLLHRQAHGTLTTSGQIINLP